jgi:GTP-binding protein Era
MLITDQHPLNKSISVALVGHPNVGKSTLINTLLGMDLSIVSAKPQTTRNQFQCVTQVDHTEIIFHDTPGLHKSMQEMNLRMNHEAYLAQEGSEVVWLLCDGSRGKDFVIQQALELKDMLTQVNQEIWLIITKMDLWNEKRIPAEKEFSGVVQNLQTQYPNITKSYLISAQEERGTSELLHDISVKAPSAPHHYPDGSMSNKNVRFFVSEFIREQVFELLQEELPYEIAVTIESFEDLDPAASTSGIVAKISAVIHVNRMGQRAIVVGQGGLMIRDIGMRARQKIENLLGGKVMLKLHAKVSEKWFKNHMMLEELGLSRAPTSIRSWREHQ